jgi:hypothetical protein
MAVNAKTVVESRESSEVEDVFNLIVEGENNFIADDVLAHSFTYLRTTRGVLWNWIARAQWDCQSSPTVEVA